MLQRGDHRCRLLHRRSKTFHSLPRPHSQQEKPQHDDLTEGESLINKSRIRPQNSLIATGTRMRHRPLTASVFRTGTEKLESKKNVVFIDGKCIPMDQGTRDGYNYSRERRRRTSSASSIRSRSVTPTEGETGRTRRSSSLAKSSLPRVPGFIRLSSTNNLEELVEFEQESENRERRHQLLERFRHAVRLVSIFSTFCMGIRRYAEQEKRTEYDLYYLRDMLPGNEDKPTPVQEASLYFNKHLFSRDNTLHFPFWARWTCALAPSDRSDAEISKLVTLLRGMKSFNKFSRQAQWHLCRTMTYARYEKRRIIIRQGHPGFCFYFIVSGTVSVTVTRCDLKTGIHVTNTVDVLEKNDSFGEIALMTDDARRTATIICRERVEVLVVNRDTVMEHCPDVFQKEFDEKFNVLKIQELFKRWTDESLRILCFESHIKELAHGKLVDPDSTTSEAVYFIIKGKVDMLRRLDLSEVIASNVSISLYDTRKLPRPSSAVPGKGKPQIEFVNVGSLSKSDSWDLRGLFTEGFNEPGNILVSAGVRLLKVPKQRIILLSPMGALDEFGKTFVPSHRCPTINELYQEYMAAQTWIEYRQKVVQNVLDCKRGCHVAHTSSLSKGTSGWGPWPTRAAKNEQDQNTLSYS